MPVRFTHSDLTRIARGYGASEAAIERLCGVVKAQQAERGFALGLNLFASGYFLGKTRDELVDETISVLTEFRSKCPKVCQWIGRGDFNPHKVPESLSAGELLHAVRTGQRLRAERLRHDAAPLNPNEE